MDILTSWPYFTKSLWQETPGILVSDVCQREKDWEVLRTRGCESRVSGTKNPFPGLTQYDIFLVLSVFQENVDIHLILWFESLLPESYFKLIFFKRWHILIWMAYGFLKVHYVSFCREALSVGFQTWLETSETLGASPRQAGDPGGSSSSLPAQRRGGLGSEQEMGCGPEYICLAFLDPMCSVRLSHGLILQLYCGFVL